MVSEVSDWPLTNIADFPFSRTINFDSPLHHDTTSTSVQHSRREMTFLGTKEGMVSDILCLDLKSVARPLAELAAFHLRTGLSNSSPLISEPQTKVHLQGPYVRFYEVLKQQLNLLAQHLDVVEICDMQNDLLERLAKISKMLDRLICTETLLQVWEEAGFVSSYIPLIDVS
jgi:hypothetical protein